MDDTHVEIMLKDALEISAEGYGGQTEAIAAVALVLVEINKNLEKLARLRDRGAMVMSDEERRAMKGERHEAHETMVGST